MSQNTDAVAAVHEAFASGDIPSLIDSLDPDVEWDVPGDLPYGGSFHGHEAVGGFFASLPEHFEELRAEPEELVDAGDYVLDVCHLRGRGRSGTEFDARAVLLWKVREGKPVSYREYSDTAELIRGINGAG